MSLSKRMLVLRAKLARLGRRLSPSDGNSATKDYGSVLVQKNFITAQELLRLNSGQQTSSTLLGKTISITDSFWYMHSLNEIFIDETYRFRCNNKSPYILDCGANIGLSAIYFKRLFPRARIIAFEADPNITKLLKANLDAFGYGDVTVENKAVWVQDSVLKFFPAGSLGGKLVDVNTGNNPALANGSVSVPAVKLESYLHEKVEFLKMDIEGAELKVLENCSAKLKNVKCLFVEYHSEPDQEQQLDRLLSILKEAGFRFYLKEAWNNLPFPYLRSDYNPCFDLQLNIFAYRN
jgi:FkbM family methyltransferase